MNAAANAQPTRPAASAWPYGALRTDLRIFPGETVPDGSPSWVIHDPLNNKFFKIGWIEFELLCNWDVSNVTRILETVNTSTPLQCLEGDIVALWRFLHQNNLLKLGSQSDVDRLREMHLKVKSFWTSLLHHYLFYRVPLVKPAFALEKLREFLQVMPWALIRAGIVILGLVGIFLVSRQWDVFTSTLLDSFTFQGLFGYLLALAIAKLLHEMGHALIATRFGVKVGHMGVAFVVLFPMLYTDTSESWKLTRSKERLLIAAGGILTELALAAICTFLWAVTPDGGFRNGIFFLATTSWLLTLAVNFSPFMRFDGYFIFSDWLSIPNLHQRSAALAQTWVRRRFLGFTTTWPESFTPRKRRLLITFAVVTWLYRQILFFGIALLVYHFFFKVLGIFLMLVELYVFMIRPIFRELSAWRQTQESVPMRLRAFWLVFFLLFLFLLFFPWRTSIHSHGLLRPATMQSIYAPFPSSVLSMPDGERFSKGDVLYVLDSSITALDIEKSGALADNIRLQIDRLIGIDGGEAQRAQLEGEYNRLQAQKGFSSSELARLVITAPFDGFLVDQTTGLAPGVTVSSKEALALFVDPGKWVADAYVTESEIAYLATGQKARVLDRQFPFRIYEAKIIDIDYSPVVSYVSSALDSAHGGPLPPISATSEVGKSGQPLGISISMFRLEIEVTGVDAGRSMTMAPVDLVITADSASFGYRFFRNFSSVLLRELVF